MTGSPSRFSPVAAIPGWQSRRWKLNITRGNRFFTRLAEGGVIQRFNGGINRDHQHAFGVPNDVTLALLNLAPAPMRRQRCRFFLSTTAG